MKVVRWIRDRLLPGPSPRKRKKPQKPKKPDTVLDRLELGGASLPAVANIILRKYGWILPAGIDFRKVVARVPAEVEEAADPVAKLLVATAPCPELAQIGLAPAAREGDSVELEVEGSPAFVLELPRFALRSRAIKPGSTSGPVNGEDFYVPYSHQKIRWLALDTTTGGWKPFMWAKSGEQRDVVGIRNGNRTIIGIDLFQYVNLSFSWMPLASGVSRRLDRGNFKPAETALRDMLMTAVKASRTPYAIVDPWPNGKRWVLSIRHDYDRLITDDEIRRILDCYAAAGIKSSWYFLTHKRISHQIRMVADAGHEIGLHTTASSSAEFRNQVSSLQVSGGRQILGVTAHGGDYIGFLGGSQIAWAMENRLVYSETQGYSHGRPYVFSTEGAQKCYGLPNHYSLDRGTQPDKHSLSSCVSAANRESRTGGGFLLMNHPDIHVPQLIAFVETVPRDTAWLATSYDMAQWGMMNAESVLTLDGTAARLVFPFQSPWQFNVKVWRPEGWASASARPGDSAIEEIV